MSDSSNYRPIALEKIIKYRHYRWTENKRITPSCQSAFRAGKSTHSNTLLFITDILIRFSFQQHTIAVFLDIISAYD